MEIRRPICVLMIGLSLGFLASLRPAQAQLIVSGPVTPVSRALQAWYDHHMPRHFQARETFTVTPFDDQQMEAYLKGDSSDSEASSHAGEDDGDVDGVFVDSPPRITLRIPDGGEPDMYTFAHEYGHYVWFDQMSESDRRHYRDIYDRQKAQNHLVTRYAATDCDEGFAEAFSFYVAEPPLLARRDPASFQFLAQMAGGPSAK